MSDVVSPGEVGMMRYYIGDGEGVGAGLWFTELLLFGISRLFVLKAHFYSDSLLHSTSSCNYYNFPQEAMF